MQATEHDEQRPGPVVLPAGVPVVEAPPVLRWTLDLREPRPHLALRAATGRPDPPPPNRPV